MSSCALLFINIYLWPCFSYRKQTRNQNKTYSVHVPIHSLCTKKCALVLNCSSNFSVPFEQINSPTKNVFLHNMTATCPSNPNEQTNFTNILQTLNQMEICNMPLDSGFSRKVNIKWVGPCNKDITPLVTHLGYVFLALTHRLMILHPQWPSAHALGQDVGCLLWVWILIYLIHLSLSC